MINLHIQKIEELWCGVALKDNRIFATTFAFSEKDALKYLLKEVPHDAIFQVGAREKRACRKGIEGNKGNF